MMSAQCSDRNERAKFLNIVLGIMQESLQSSPNPLSLEDAMRHAYALVQLTPEGSVH